MLCPERPRKGRKAQKGPGSPIMEGWGLSMYIVLMVYMCPVTLYNDAGAILLSWAWLDMGKAKKPLKTRLNGLRSDMRFWA